MPRHTLLNNIDHKDLRVILRFGAEFGDNVATVLTFPTEYSDIQREYPIFFRRDSSTGEYQSIALLGFEKGENLFIDSGRWDAHYVPGIIARGPFLIGFQERLGDGEMRKEAVVHVDLDNPRISFTEGRPVFLPEGGNTPYLNHIAAVLRGIHEGMEVSKAMFAAFTALDLIEPIKLEVKISDEETFNLAGLNTISQEKLRSLDSESLFRLHRSGFLQGAYLALASVSNVNKLMTMKQRRRHAEVEGTRPGQ